MQDFVPDALLSTTFESNDGIFSRRIRELYHLLRSSPGIDTPICRDPWGSEPPSHAPSYME